MPVGFEDRKKSGSLAAAQDAVTINSPGASTLCAQVTGTFTGTITWEASVDQTTFVAINALKVQTGASATTTTGTGLFTLQIGGFVLVRARCSAYTSGTAVVTLNASSGGTDAGFVAASAGGGGGGAVTVADGADVAEGTTTDAAVTTDTTGTVIGFLRGNIVKWVSALTLYGAVNETAPATDTASSGLNGRLQRIAQRVTSLIALVPAALVSGRFDVNLGAAPATVTCDTEMPAAGALGDSVANPTTPYLGSMTYFWDGSTWQRTICHSTSSDGRALTNQAPIVMAYGYGFNGTTEDRIRTANGAANTTGTGLMGAGHMVFDGTNWQKGKGDTNGFQQMNAGGSTATISATLTRPANTTAYTANDELTDTGGAILTLTSIATKSGGSGIITHVAIAVSTNAATKPDLTLFFYDTTSTPQTDNTAFAPSDGVQDTCIGYVRITDTQVGDVTSNTGNFVMDSGQIHIPFTTSGSANLFVRIKMNNAYTAGANSDTYKIRAKALQDY